MKGFCKKCNQVREASGNICPHCGGFLDVEAVVDPADVARKRNADLTLLRAYYGGWHNTYMGVLGALLGAIVGILPTILLNMTGIALGALVGVCSGFGYKIFKGRPGMTKFFVVLICALVVSYIGYFFAVAVDLHRELNGLISMGEAISLVFESFEGLMAEGEVVGELMEVMIFTVVGAGLVTFSSFTEARSIAALAKKYPRELYMDEANGFGPDR